MKHLINFLFVCAILNCASLWAAGQTVWTTSHDGFTVNCETGSPGAVGKVNEEITIAVTVAGKRKGFFSTRFYVNGKEVGQKMLVPVGESAKFSTTLKEPGIVYARYTISDAAKKHILGKNKQVLQGGLGVIVSPGEIKPGNSERPYDFDAFWDRKRAELDQLPMKADYREVPLPAAHKGVRCADVTVDCPGGRNVTGFLCMPDKAAPKSLPAIVYFNGAGVFSAGLHTGMGKLGITFDVNAHGLKNGQPRAYYDTFAKGELKNYRTALTGDPGKDYFTGMFVRVMRALDYVKSLPEWNGRDLIVRGMSQGGAQAFVAAALDKDVTLCCAEVPALTDHGGRLANRQPGWPRYFDPATPDKVDRKKLKETAYFDLVFFAPRVKCPVYMSVGLIDNVCLAPSIYAAYNLIPQGTAKTMFVNPGKGHDNSFSIPGRKATEAVFLKKR